MYAEEQKRKRQLASGGTVCVSGLPSGGASSAERTESAEKSG